MQPKLLSIMAFTVMLFICTGVSAQNKVIKGKVQDENGAPVPKASIMIKGSQAGTSSGDDGSFELTVPAKATLIISAIGFNRSEIKTGTQNVVNLSLTPDSRSLSEVVVTALGVKREKRNLTFSSQEIKADELVRAKESNHLASRGTLTAANALQRIMEEKKIANFLSIENFNDWRRTGFPVLTKVPNALSDIPRRLLYPQVEITSNPQSGQLARLTDRVWWDK